MKTYKVTGPAGERTVLASSEEEARHRAMVARWGDVSDNVVPRSRDKDGRMKPYVGRGLSVRELES